MGQDHAGVDTPPSQQHVPLPAMSPEDEERELNAAAAREVSREMDALTFNPPVHDSFRDTSPDPSAVQHSRGPGIGGSPPLNLPPLAPPSAPFTHRSPSPRPTMDSTTVPPYPGASPSITPAQAYAQAHASSTSLEQTPPEHSSPMMANPRLNTTVTPGMHLYDDVPARSSPLTQSPYQTPPDHQRTSGAGTGGSPTPNFKSISSSNLLTGPRTISAAAFKRPPARKVTGDLSIADTSPLSLKKRLPNSPQPQPRDPSPMGRSASFPPPGNPGPLPNHNVGAEQGGELEEDYDYLSAYVNSGPIEDAGSLGPLRIANETGDGDGHHAQGGYGHSRGGYGDGRFATDLEGLR
jgi:hypothetical protein